jgi:hypothetical protein
LVILAYDRFRTLGVLRLALDGEPPAARDVAATGSVTVDFTS